MNLAQKFENSLPCPEGPGTRKESYPSIYLNGEQAKDFEKEFSGLKIGEEMKAVVTLKPCRASVGEDGVDSLSLDICEIKPHKEHERPPKFEGMIGGILRQMKGEA